MKYKDFMHLYFDDAGADGANTGTDAGTDTGAGNSQGKPGDDRDAKKYSDNDLDAILNKRFAKWKKQQDKAVDEAKKLANMTAQEKAEHERDLLQAELDELKAKNERAEMEKTARGILQQDGVNVSDVIVASLIGEDAEATSANVKAFTKAYKADVQNAVKASLAHKTPDTGSGTQTYSRDDIRKEKDTHKRLEMYRTNMGISK